MKQMTDFSGQQIGPYTLGKLLGVGGMGAVYESYQGTVKRRVAIKILLLDVGHDPQVLARFDREVELAAEDARTRLAEELVLVHDPHLVGVRSARVRQVDRRVHVDVVAGNRPAACSVLPQYGAHRCYGRARCQRCRRYQPT